MEVGVKPASLLPCCVQAPADWENTQTAPLPLLSWGPPATSVLASPERATEVPCPGSPAAPVPTSLSPCCFQAPAARVNTQTAPTPLLSPGPPTAAVLPSEDSATAQPWFALATAPVPTNLAPVCVHWPPERVNTQAAPVPVLSPGPPMIAVLPSAERARPALAGVPDRTAADQFRPLL